MTNINGWLLVPNMGLVAAALMLSLLGLMLAATSPVVDRWNRRCSTLSFLVLSLYAVACLADELLAYLGGNTLYARIAVFFMSVLSAEMVPLLTNYMLHCRGEDWRKSRLMWAVMALWTVYFILLCVAQFTTFIYYFTDYSIYHRGPWYPLLLVPPVLTLALNLVSLIRNRAALTRRQFTAFLACFTAPGVCMLIQMLFYGLNFVGIGMSVSALFLYENMVWEHYERYTRQQAEIARQRASILVLQMRPHFISNTMTSIYYLCEQDTKKAQQVILDFNNYLRRNFTAIVREDTIPFPEELEHTRAYLAVEQVRFEGQLQVELDTPHTAFRLPPLTLQPIVENAVRHGIDPELKPLKVSIRTQAWQGGSRVIVEDTGPGYKPTDDPSSIGLSNIRDRLEMMCGGTLEIASREGCGTVVTVFVP